MNTKVIFPLFLTSITISCSGSLPATLGVANGKFHPCPSSPNCVSSQSSKKKQYVDPIPYKGDMKDARKALLSVLASLKRTVVIDDENNYLHAECTSAVFRFVDDLEFFFDDRKKVIQVKSASRVGYSDMGVNRKRVEKIRKEFKAREENR